MSGDYRKYTVEMKAVTDKYRLWRRGLDSVICVIESYKNKRSVYFAVSNFLSSSDLLTDAGREYHLVLIGAEEGVLIHKDFGEFFINQRGEGSFFKKFEGPDIESYTHCLFLAAENETGKTETILSGKMPFYIEEEIPAEEETPFDVMWRNTLALFSDENIVEAFSTEKDETGAKWYRISNAEELPQALNGCRNLIEKYNHYIFGEKKGKFYIGIPGRFLKSEQPCREKRLFMLWQPIRGGESFFDDFTQLTGKLQEEIFGYWIAGINAKTGKIGRL